MANALISNLAELARSRAASFWRCDIVASTAIRPFRYIEEGDDPFLALFPHRFDYIYAPHPEPGQTPAWQTESRYPLSDRVLRQGAYLLGVRFGAQTKYCLLDIDIGSLYHPRQDKLAIGRITAALEPLGLASYVVCTSSHSGGLHLYFPFSDPQSSWEIASVVALLLEQAGFQLKPGQLELFPNPKPYIVEGSPSLFNAHRLPLQIGSYLLNQDFQPVWSDETRFVRQWQFAQNHNLVDRLTLKRILKQAKRKRFCISGKADKFINDLNAEIEMGWTGSGQTNRLLGRIAMRSYIFHHVLTNNAPLEGKALIHEIISIAKALPGYEEWCNHQHEIDKRAEEWARCVENSHYFHYGSSQGKYKQQLELLETESSLTALPTWNQQQAEITRTRIRQAITDLLEQDKLPATATARFHALRSYQIGGGSLYRHRDLWHPKCLSNNMTESISDQSSVRQASTDQISMDQIGMDQTAVDRIATDPITANQIATDQIATDRTTTALAAKEFVSDTAFASNTATNHRLVEFRSSSRGTQTNPTIQHSCTSLLPTADGENLTGKGFSACCSQNAARLGGNFLQSEGNQPDSFRLDLRFRLGSSVQLLLPTREIEFGQEIRLKFSRAATSSGKNPSRRPLEAMKLVEMTADTCALLEDAPRFVIWALLMSRLAISLEVQTDDDWSWLLWRQSFRVLVLHLESGT